MLLTSEKPNVAKENAKRFFVGIAMATYNPCLPFFIDQIESLKNQTMTHWVCIIVDDCSSPEKYQNIIEIVGDDSRFRIYRNDANQGSFKTFERALELLPDSANLICFCDQDDIWIPTKLEIQSNQFENEDVFLVHSDQSLVDERNQIFVKSCWQLEGRSIVDASTDLLLFRNLITGCTSMFRREVLSSALPFYQLRPRQEMYHHDMWIAMHACAKGRVFGIKEALVMYRQHAGNAVGVSSLRRTMNMMDKFRKARQAFNERLAMREDFLDSLSSIDEKVYSIETHRLSYLDHPTKLAIRGFHFVRHNPLFLRTWLMLFIGLAYSKITSVLSNGRKLSNI